MQTAAYWKKTGEAIQCELCPHYCRILSGRTGRCGIRRNADGTLIAETYGLISSLAMDPVEKKPLFHFKPGSAVFSIAATGCNFRCLNCQNWEIS
ncbi:AmmeMemoRadiSam system radical SAM enzyme, partial [bacterium]|nr:AmmeMemoRadiSam system radical SAM enzyme [bacterium]